MKTNETAGNGETNLGSNSGNRMMLEKNVGPGFGDAGDAGNLVVEGVTVLPAPSHAPLGTIQFPEDKKKEGDGKAGAKANASPAPQPVVPLKPAESDAPTTTATAPSGTGGQNAQEAPADSAAAPVAAPKTGRDWTLKPLPRTIPRQKYHLFDEEAYIYWMTPIAPGAFAPSTYVRRAVVEELYELRGKKPLGIADAKAMVQLNGEAMECAIKKAVFQPVKYLVSIQERARKAISNGVPLSAAGLSSYLFYGGCFYVVESEDKAPYAVGLSGSKLIFVNGQFLENHHSPLMNIAKMFSQHSGKPQWGVTREEANARVEKLIEEARQTTAMKQLFVDLAKAPAPNPKSLSWKPIPKAK